MPARLPRNTRLHVGLFADTLGPFLASYAGGARGGIGGDGAPLALAHVDCDLYSSTRDALDALAPRVVVGSVIVFDEYLGHATWRDDEAKAWLEACAARGWAWETLAVSLATKQLAVRVTAVRGAAADAHADGGPA